jgi:hypothetical protein
LKTNSKNFGRKTMMQSEQIDQLVTALAKAQGEILPAAKDGMNPHFKNKYAGLPSIWAACREPLSRNQLVVIQTTDHQDGRLILVTTLAHSSGQWIRSNMPIVSAKPDAQSMGSAMTYAKRYSLSAIVGVVADEDDDGERAVARNAKDEPVLITKSQAHELGAILDKCDDEYIQNLWSFLIKQNIHKLDKLPAAYFDRVMTAAKKNRDKPKPDISNQESISA